MLSLFYAREPEKLVELYLTAPIDRAGDILAIMERNDHNTISKILQANLSRVHSDGLLHRDIPNEELREQFRAAKGVLHIDFAFCQSMPVDVFRHVVTTLKPLGFRPTRIRPYRLQAEQRLAAIWVRDGILFNCEFVESKEEFERLDDKFATDGFQLADVAGFSHENSIRFFATWRKRRVQPKKADGEPYSGAEEDDEWSSDTKGLLVLTERELEAVTESKLLVSVQRFLLDDGDCRYCAIVSPPQKPKGRGPPQRTKPKNRRGRANSF